MKSTKIITRVNTLGNVARIFKNQTLSIVMSKKGIDDQDRFQSYFYHKYKQKKFKLIG